MNMVYMRLERSTSFPPDRIVSFDTNIARRVSDLRISFRIVGQCLYIFVDMVIICVIRYDVDKPVILTEKYMITMIEDYQRLGALAVIPSHLRDTLEWEGKQGINLPTKLATEFPSNTNVLFPLYVVAGK